MIPGVRSMNRKCQWGMCWAWTVRIAGVVEHLLSMRLNPQKRLTFQVDGEEYLTENAPVGGHANLLYHGDDGGRTTNDGATNPKYGGVAEEV